MAKLLILEASREDQISLKKALGEQHECFFTEKISEFSKRCHQLLPDLLIVNPSQVEKSEIEALSNLLLDDGLKQIPIFIISSERKNHNPFLADAIRITKPFETKELHSFINKKLKPFKKPPYLSYGGLHLDLEKSFVSYEGLEAPIELSALDFKLLHYFMLNSETVLTRQQLLKNVWGSDVFITDRNIDTRISGLRKLLKPYGNRIKTIYGIGYQFSNKNIKQDAA